MNNKKLQLIKGNEHTDHRGTLCFINDFNMSSIKRVYTITHPSTSIVRAWQAHKVESKCFKCIKGRFLIAVVEIDNWEKPSKKLQAKTFILNAKDTEVLKIPGGYANGFKAMDADAQLLVFSDKDLKSAKHDQFRFDENLWMNWKEHIY